MPTRIFIDGEHGTTGLQIRSRLEGRRDLDLISIPTERRKDPAARAELLRDADFAILCLPDDAARESVAMAEGSGTRIIDASTAHRTADGWTYGFPEIGAEQAEAIRSAPLVANPGCWPQGPIALLRPLILAGLLPADHAVSVNGISGYSGGGRQMIEEYEARGEAAPEYLPYGLTLNHKHLPELQRYAKLSRTPLMQPVVGNFAQGMLTAVPLHLGALPRVPRGAELHRAIADHHAGVPSSTVTVAPFEASERVAALDPESRNGTDGMTLHVFANDARAQALLVAVYDNLGKGASGAAVQNLELMLTA